MQYIVYSVEASEQAAGSLSPEGMIAMGQFMEEAIKAGTIVTTGGIAANGTRVRLADGQFTVTDGPFVEAKELMGGFAVLRANSIEEVIEYAKKFRTIVGDGVTEIVPIFGPMADGPA